MKKNYTILAIVTIICSIISVFSLIISAEEITVDEGDNTEIMDESSNENISESDNRRVDDVEGYVLAAKEVVFFAKIFVYGIAYLVAVTYVIFVPTFIYFLMSGFQFFSLLFLVAKGDIGKNSVSRVLTIVSFIFSITLVLVLILNLCIGWWKNIIYALVALILSMICLITHVITIVKGSKLINTNQNQSATSVNI